MNHLQRFTDRVITFYLLTTAGFVVLFHQQVSHWETYVGIHLLASGLIFSLRFVCGRLSPFLQFLRDWYPACIFPVLYKEVEIFAGAFGDWRLTQEIRELEATLFHGHPSIYLSEWLAWALLSEYLHLCYLSYLLLFPVVGGYWYFTGRVAAFRELLFLLSITLCASYLIFILFPVDSPFYLSSPLGEPMAGHFFYQLVHFVSRRGGARGGAFPSAHVSLATVVWLVAWKRQRQLCYLLSPLLGGLILATVYGRFHYVLDAIAGLALGVLIVGAYRLRTSSR